MSELPPCGLYVTRLAIGDVPAGRLVFFHDHGDPGPGIYLPTRWVGNEARFEQPGTPLGDVDAQAALVALPPEGLYRVARPFHCCAKRCRAFEVDAMVQLGYDGAGNAILFDPALVEGRITIPDHGSRVDRAQLEALAQLRVTRPARQAPEDRTLH